MTSNAIQKNNVLLKPRVTEKSGLASEHKSVFTFEVSKDATKLQITKAINDLYKVIPVKVNIINLPSKRVLVRGKLGQTPKVKKALVYLKKGDKIEFI
ncbi:MAG: 50S ribosomal protein L23 [Patescibacteria group bacterium]|nr:50S ribosomal protein L23 [Patescibacteria group bacterium]